MEFNGNNNGGFVENGINNENLANGNPNTYGMNNNINSNMYGMNNNINPNMYSTNNNFNTSEKKKGAKIFFVILLIIGVLIVLGIFVMASMKSKEQKFIELLMNKQAMVGFANEIAEKIENNEQVNTSIECNIKDLLKGTKNEIEDDLKVQLDIENAMKKDNIFGSATTKINEKPIITLEYAKTGEIYGIKIEDTTEKFIAIENKDLEDLYEKLDVSDTETLPNKLLTAEDLKAVMKIDSKTLNKIMSQYAKIVLNNIDGKVTKEDDVEITLGSKDVKATKYTLNMTDKAAYNITLAIVKELKDDNKNIELVLNDIKSILELMEKNGYLLENNDILDELPTVEELQEQLEDMYAELKELDAKDFDDEEVIFSISVYEYKNQNVATEIEAENGAKMIFKCIADKDFYMALEMITTYDEKVVFILDGTFDDKKIEADFIVKSGDNKIKLLTIRQEYLGKAKGFVFLNEENALILNNATDKEIEKLEEELSSGLEELIEKVGKELGEMFPSNGMISQGEEENYIPDFDNSWEYNDYDFNSTSEMKTGMLAKTQEMYNKVKIGDTKQAVIQKLGEPDDISTYTSSFDDYTIDTLYWKDDDILLLSVKIQDGKVIHKINEIYSSKLDNVYIGKELNATLDDLNVEILKVKEGMTLVEVKEILGNAVFESEQDEDLVSYTWYDKQENYITIDFENGKVWYIGMVWKMF